MNQIISFKENGIYVVIEITENKDVRLLHFSALPFDKATLGDEKQQKYFRLVELQVSGEDQDDHHGSKHTGTMPGKRLVYRLHKDYHNHHGRKLEIELEGDGLVVISHLQFFNSISVVQVETEVKNNGSVPKGLEYVTSFALTGIAKEGLLHWEEKSRLHIPHNTWNGEAQWKEYDLPELGLARVNEFSINAWHITVLEPGRLHSSSRWEFVQIGNAVPVCFGRLNIMAPGIGRSVISPVNYICN